MPRVQPDSLKGLVTDVCQKRKIRNFFTLYNPDGTLRPDGTTAPRYQIFIRENAILQDDLDRTHQSRSKFLFGKLAEALVEKGYLEPEASAEIMRECEFDEFPSKPKDCADFVLKACQGSMKFTPLVTVASNALAARAEFGSQIADQLRTFQLPVGNAESQEATKTDGGSEVRETSDSQEAATGSETEQSTAKAKKPKKLSPEDVAIEAIVEKAKALAKSLKGKGIVKMAQGLVKNAIDQQKPSALLQVMFGQLPLENTVRAALCECYFDVRAFGAVVSTKGPLEGSFYGQIRGPIQFTFAESLDKVLQLDATITRCAKASKDEQSGDDAANRTMGRKHGIDYGLYRCHIHFSPAFAAKTGFTYADLDNFLFALKHCLGDYNVDIAAARAGGSDRGGMCVRGIIVFRHTSALGNAPAHKLFDLVQVRSRTEATDGKQVFRSSGSEFPRGLDDYEGTPPKDEYHVTKDGKVEAGKNGEDVAVISVKRIVWEIPEVKKV